MTEMTDQSAPFLGLANDAGFATGDPAWLQSLRMDGAARYATLGLPDTKLENWKYTNLQPIGDITFRPAQEADGAVAVDAIPGLESPVRMVLVNGYYREELSDITRLPEGVSLRPLESVVAENPEWLEQHLGRVADDASRALIALNAAAVNTGYVLQVKKGVVVDGVIEIVSLNGFVDDSVANFPRNLIVLEENAQARMVINHAGSSVGEYMNNIVTEISLAQNARLNLATLQEDALEATHLSNTFASVARDAVFDSFTLSMGGRMTRNDSLVTLDGEGAECRLDGAYLMRGRQHCDNTTRVEHKVPDTRSDEMFKGVLDDEARAVFQGKIVVERDAQRTDGQMLNKTMLLSDRAEIDTKPELEIYADDVKCAHGAASGQVDETALFYLRSRGIPEAHARNLLIQSFMGQVVDRIADEALRELVIDKIVHWLPAACYQQEEWRSA